MLTYPPLDAMSHQARLPGGLNVNREESVLFSLGFVCAQSVRLVPLWTDCPQLFNSGIPPGAQTRAIGSSLKSSVRTLRPSVGQPSVDVEVTSESSKSNRSLPQSTQPLRSSSGVWSAQVWAPAVEFPIFARGIQMSESELARVSYES